VKIFGTLSVDKIIFNFNFNFPIFLLDINERLTEDVNDISGHGAASDMRVVRAVEVLPPLRSSDRTRRPAGDPFERFGRRRQSGRGRFGHDVAAAPHGVATFVTQQISQEWCPAPPADAARASDAYRREAARGRRDLLPKA
jgi:hypothetical protein